MKALPIVGAALAALFLTGCATPDFKPFADSTAALSGAVKQETSAVQGRFKDVQQKIKAWDPTDKRTEDLGAAGKQYAADTKRVEAVLTLAVGYSESVADLAAEGEGGEKAANSIVDSFKRFGALANVAFPGAGGAADVLQRLLTSVSVAITRIQAQKTLDAALDVAENGDPSQGIRGPVPLIEESLAALFGPKGAQRNLAAGLHGVEDGVDLDIAGFNQVALYRSLAVQKVQIKGISTTLLDHMHGVAGESLLTLDSLAGTCFEATLPGQSQQRQYCLPKRPEALAAFSWLVKEAREKSDRFREAQVSNARFAAQRDDAADGIVAAAHEWREGHRKLSAALKECGGLKALRKSCGNLTFTNLRAAVAKLQSIAGKGDK